MKVLAIGATGRFARLVVPALASRGVAVRALVHDPAKTGRVRDLGADETMAGDLRDRESIDAALKGVDGVFHVTPPLRRTPRSWVSAWWRRPKPPA